MKYKILSWNVNGIRAVEKKGFLDWLGKEKPCILAVQETKASEEQLSDSLKNPSSYKTYWNSAERKGYSGVGFYTKDKPANIEYGLGNQCFDGEGRVIIAEYKHFVIYNIYFPNGRMGKDRLNFKLDFYGHFLKKLGQTLKKKDRKTLIICGDFNTAHREIDLARPKENRLFSGFLPEERELLDKLIDLGMVDTFRAFNKEGGHYTYWDLQTRARRRNVGWRIDYFFMDKPSVKHLQDAFMLNDVQGSDHCPVGIKLQF